MVNIEYSIFHKKIERLLVTKTMEFILTKTWSVRIIEFSRRVYHDSSRGDSAHVVSARGDSARSDSAQLQFIPLDQNASFSLNNCFHYF